MKLNHVTRRAAILKIKKDYSLSLDKNDSVGWKKVWEVLEKKKWVSGSPSRSSYYRWWFKDNGVNQLDPFQRKVFGPNEDKSIKDFATMLSLVADSFFNRYGICKAIVPGPSSLPTDLDPVWSHLVLFIDSKKHSNDAFLEYLKENGNLCVDDDEYDQCYKAIDSSYVPGSNRQHCKASKKAKSLFLEVAGVNLVGTKREQFPPFDVVWADFNKWLENNPKMQGLREAVKRLISAQVELYRAWIRTYTREERDAFYLKTVDPKLRDYAEEMVERYWELNERCGCGQCDDACAENMEWDHDLEKELDGVNGVEQKRLDEEEFGSGEPTSLNRAQLIVRRPISTIRCPTNHRLKNPIAIADPILSKKSYRPIEVTRYDLLFQLQAAAVGVTCEATGGETITKATWAAFEGQHAAGMKNLRDGGVEYETAKLYERGKLYRESWHYTEWKKNVFPELLKLCHLRKAVHRVIDFRLMPRIDLVLEMLRKRGVEIDWPYEVVDGVLVRKEELPIEHGLDAELEEKNFPKKKKKKKPRSRAERAQRRGDIRDSVGQEKQTAKTKEVPDQPAVEEAREDVNLVGTNIMLDQDVKSDSEKMAVATELSNSTSPMITELSWTFAFV